ncbi:MAG TPA: D-glycero-beta-D-manno-heptose 1,7-bisphosphate 7-phosphatase [Kofleriaceae bacterium]|nr:D-glycero-beta-D-manno-heptose 1,7-bisphosphate 7-phosphatase [Kofleriaceae bacterium]
MRRCVFLDRDGVINEEVEYLHEPERVALVAGAAEAIAALGRAGLAVVVVTNQAGIARGMYTERELAAVTARIGELLAGAGARLDGVYFCPHHPEAGRGPYRIACRCRKPGPAMLEQAAAELGLDLAGSAIVGDKASDLEAGRAAGCAAVLVRTGYGAQEEARLIADARADLADAVFDSLAAAAPWLIARLGADAGADAGAGAGADAGADD